VISPLLSNIYLHEVLDKWFEQEVKPRLRGQAFLVRFADDAVLGFEHQEDAERFLAVLPKRFGRYGLTLHPEKTKLVMFERPKGKPEDNGQVGSKGPGTFDFLGFTHYWGPSRKGSWVVKRKTMKKRFTRALKRIKEWCRAARHWKIREQHKELVRKVSGHYQYYGITGNFEALRRFLHEVRKLWKRWLGRRGQKARKGGWEWFDQMTKTYPLPPARVVHSIYQRAANP
jgi:RNA-directed DNA polymerase